MSSDQIARIKKLLESVCDPEIPVLTIDDMGIVRNLEYLDGRVLVYITPTYTGCPAMDMISVQIKSTLQEAGFNNVEVIQVLQPEWTTDWLSEDGKRKLREYGIAPPAEKTTDKSFLQGKAPSIHCPLCDSSNTEMISRFGSTPCKSLYRCKDCLEPFDYFKCH